MPFSQTQRNSLPSPSSPFGGMILRWTPSLPECGPILYRAPPRTRTGTITLGPPPKVDFRGGKALMSFSNRCFPSKAVKMWLYADDATRMEIVASYYNFAPQGGWDNIEAYDIKKGGDAAAPDALADPLGFLGALFGSVGGDPMFVVAGTKR